MQLTFLHSGSEILAKSLTDYINGAYVEFQQGSDAVTDLPEVDPADTGYYDNLRHNTLDNRDFIRSSNVVAVTKKTGTGWQIVFQVLFSETHGESGKSVVGSRVYGAALVHMPSKDTAIDDITRDIVFARGYFQPESQGVVTDSEQQVITFTLNL
jgi:hypothetical protein